MVFVLLFLKIPKFHVLFEFTTRFLANLFFAQTFSKRKSNFSLKNPYVKGYVSFTHRLKLFVISMVNRLHKSFENQNFQVKKPPKTRFGGPFFDVNFSCFWNFLAIVSNFNSFTNKFTQVNRFISPNISVCHFSSYET